MSHEAESKNKLFEDYITLLKENKKLMEEKVALYQQMEIRVVFDNLITS